MKAGAATERRVRAPALSDRLVNRLLVGGVLVLVVGVPLFGVLYFLDRNVDPGPSLVNRQIASIEDAVRTSPNSVSARLELAGAYITARRLDDALVQYDEILTAEAGNKAATLGRADVLLLKGDLDGAAQGYQSIVDTSKGGEFAKVDTYLERAYYSLGSIALKRSRPADAIPNLQGALGINGADADALDLLGSAYLETGAADKAVDPLRDAVLFVPTGWSEPYALLARAYTTLGNAAEAEWAGAMVAFCEKRPQEASKRLLALQGGPASVDAMLGLGLIAETSGDRSGAIGWYQAVLARDSGNFVARSGLGRLNGSGASGSPHPSIPGASPAVGGNG